MRLGRILGVVTCLTFWGCAVDSGLEDGTWQVSGKVSEASLTVMPDGTGHVDFVFEYLLGLVDDEGIEAVTWSYALTDTSRQSFGETVEPMRETKPNESSPLFVEGTRNRRLPIERNVLERIRTYVLWIKVYYRDETLYELLVPVASDVPHVDEAPIEELRQFSIGN